MLLPGQKFNRLTVQEYISSMEVKCICDCLTPHTTTKYSLTHDKVKSCGCLNLELIKSRTKENNSNYKGGYSAHPLYKVWQQIKIKGLHVSLHDAWRDSVDSFITWAESNGWIKGMVVSRKDKSLGYNPDNCFITTKGSVAKNNTNSDKSKQTCLNKYGVEHPGQMPEFWTKVRSTCKEKYGTEFPQKLDATKDKVIITNLERYGVANYAKTNECKDKITATCLSKYGVRWPTLIPESRAKQKTTQINTGTAYVFKNKTTKEWAEELGVSRSHFLHNVRNYGFDVATSLSKTRSNIEILIQNFLNELEIKHTQKQIDGMKPDFVLDDHNLIIECDGLYWHSDAINKNKFYHRDKQRLYTKHGYRSLFFREDELKYKFEIVKSVIGNKLGLSNKIYARKTTVVHNVLPIFFKDNHLMGRGQGKIIGLSNGSWPVMAIQYVNKSTHIELSRVCSVLNTVVIGGLSKLLSQLTSLFPKKDIISFVDLRYGNGVSLEKVGFVKETDSVSFKWVKDDKSFHRMTYPGNTGYENRCAKIWDCGQVRYRLNGV